MRVWWRAAVTAFAFLTRLPVDPGPVTDADLGRSAAFFPLVGVALGLACVGLDRALRAIGVPAPLVAVLVVALLAALSGGLHLDGVADLFDGLAGGRGDRERTLAIMRDSRIGAHGALALVLVVLAKVVAVHELLARGDGLALLAVPAVARWAVLPQLAFFPYARPDGLGRAFHETVGIVVLGVSTIFVSGLAISVRHHALGELPAALGISLAIAFWVRPRLGGLTGDVHGATIELCEVAALLATVTR